MTDAVPATKVTIRRLETTEEFLQCIQLQRDVWGVSDLEATSPVTLASWATPDPTMALLFGAFLGQEMVGEAILLPTFEPGVIFGHALGVHPRFHNTGLGARLLVAALDCASELGARRVVFTFEPLESRNAHLYLNRLHARAVIYHANHFSSAGELNAGLPIDRFVAEAPLPLPPESRSLPRLQEALQNWPVALGQDRPEAEVALVEIPCNLGALKASDMEAALRWRLQTRELLLHYLQDKRYAVEGLIRGQDGASKARRSLYLLRRLTPERKA